MRGSSLRATAVLWALAVMSGCATQPQVLPIDGQRYQIQLTPHWYGVPESGAFGQILRRAQATCPLGYERLQAWTAEQDEEKTYFWNIRCLS